MANWYASQSGAGLNDGTTEDNAWPVASIVWGAGGVVGGDNLYLLGTITSVVNIGTSGGTDNPAVIRGDGTQAGVFDCQGATNSILTKNVGFWVEIRNLTFINPPATENQQMVSLDRCQAYSVIDCTFIGDGVAQGRGISLRTQGGTNGLNRILIEGNTFTNLGGAAVTLVNYADQDASTPNRITYRNNTITDCYRGFQIIEDRNAWTQVDGGWIPYGMDYDGNTLTNVVWAMIQVMWKDGYGATNGYISYLRNNKIYNTGRADTEAINCIQLEAAKGGYVENNLVDGVVKIPQNGDGHCFILDYVKDSTLPALYTDNVTVRWNTFKNARTLGTNMNTSGIRCFRGTNNIIYGNKIESCLTGIGNSGVNSTGNVYYNNTCKDIIQRGLQIDQSSAQCTARNNIFDMRTGNFEGLANDLTGVQPIETNNVFYNATDNGWDLNASDSEDDPMLNNDLFPATNSSAIGLGVTWWGNEARENGFDGEPFPDTEIDAGAYQTTYNPNHPKNL